MVESGELRRYRSQEKSNPNLYSLPGVKKPINDNHLYGHEMDCADVFVSLKQSLALRLIRWERYTDLEKDMKQHYHKYGVRPDRIFEIDDVDQVFYLEVDRGTEDLEKQIIPKLESYIRFSDAHQQGITVLFTAQGYRYHKEDEHRANELYSAISRYRRGNQFLITLHRKMVESPLEAIFNSPMQHQVSILTL